MTLTPLKEHESDPDDRKAACSETFRAWTDVMPRVRSESTPIRADDLRMLVVEFRFGTLEEKTSLRPGTAATFGRRSSADLQIPCDPCLSGVHFTITCAQQHGTIRDHRSTNGTFVNGQRVVESQLRDGDHIIAGMTLFKVRYAYA